MARRKHKTSSAAISGLPVIRRQEDVAEPVSEVIRTATDALAIEPSIPSV